jgi:hypothetical protein
MIASFIKTVKSVFRNRLPGEFLLLSGILITIMAVFFSTIVTAQDERPDNALGYYTKDGKAIWIFPEDNIITTDTRNLSPSEMEKLYPMSPEDEAAIVHTEPTCPVIVDGIRHKGKEISKFNGRRLYFVIGKDGNFYAFTTPERLEQFQAENSELESMLSGGLISEFYENIGYMGREFGMDPGDIITNLSWIGFDNILSSVKASSTASWVYLYDLYDRQGDCLAIPGGMDVWELVTYGWNDRASSVWVKQ